MSWYLLELLTEEIPARMQEKAAEQLDALFRKKFSESSVDFKTLETFITPRRLGIFIEGLPEKQEDRTEERKGPSVTASTQAIEGFLRSANIILDDCEKREIPGKGSFYFLQKIIKGEPLTILLSKMVKEILEEFQWPKSMRWGSYSFSWVRPLRSIVSLFDNEVVPLALEDPHITVGRLTHGHRFLSPETLEVHSFDDYKKKMRASFVLCDPKERATVIKDQIEEICRRKNLLLKEDPNLLKEVVGLTEWPVVVLGRIDEKFMKLPSEVLETTMRVHQRYFTVLNQDKTSAPYFLVVSNINTIDQQAQIAEGNERVLRARLSDAEFFWDHDQKIPLVERLQTLKNVVFHEKIGSMEEKAQRIKLLSSFCFFGDRKNYTLVETAAELSKADLATGMVGEFPELQGIMGGYYAEIEGQPASVTTAIKEHYSPLGTEDNVPTAPISVAVSLADKIDTLVSFWAANIRPTGSKDPYALRRCALGIIRLILKNELTLPLKDIFSKAYDFLPKAMEKISKETLLEDLINFFKDRLKIFLKNKGLNPSIIDAALPSNWDGDIYQSYQIIEALVQFLQTPGGQDLVIAYKRAANIVDSTEMLKIDFDESLLEQEEEQDLYQSFSRVERDVKALLKITPDYRRVLERFSDLREPLDAFFDRVTVQAENQKVRMNRLILLQNIRTLLESVANFSVIALP
jgi:glycyl-tRNA synthetase beta chain